eukprot:TRINITY_DN4433_c0_g1_i7.p1 TRINITY_DN4433_c0_g1~~TRINITY_DN4433_c0_g1_i7.p1  ORF type:complete len:125 (-),score=11.93 TRINITY_DN4433_c0_g1_i7:61-435(-)
MSLSLNISGYIFAGIDTANSTTPTPQQFRLGLNGEGKPMLSRNVFFYDGIAINHYFAELETGQTYKVYLAASNADPGPFAPFTPVITYTSTTGSPAPRIQITKGVILQLIIVLNLIFVLSLIHI